MYVLALRVVKHIFSYLLIQRYAAYSRKKAAIEGYGCDWREGAAIERKHEQRAEHKRREVESNDFRQTRAVISLLIIESSD